MVKISAQKLVNVMGGKDIALLHLQMQMDLYEWMLDHTATIDPAMKIKKYIEGLQNEVKAIKE